MIYVVSSCGISSSFSKKKKKSSVFVGYKLCTEKQKFVPVASAVSGLSLSLFSEIEDGVRV